MIKTAEGEKVSSNNCLLEYPRPQFRRDSYFPLNGMWDFSIDHSKAIPSQYPDKILVPFSVESPLSGIGKTVRKEDVLHYRRFFTLPQGFNQGVVLLHLDAVDQIVHVFLNGKEVGHHEGGYLPLCVELHDIQEGENELCLTVTDDTDSSVFPRGKQSNKASGIWYTPTSGVWQSVWLESVPHSFITSVKLTPDFDKKSLWVHVSYAGDPKWLYATVMKEGQKAEGTLLDQAGNGVLDLSQDFHPWSPEDPHLYDLDLICGEDVVHAYFAMRKCSVGKVKGKKVFCLNDKPILLSGVLDQGYFPESGLTPPTDEAMAQDIRLMKEMGFNFIRKHIKIEPLRWYYHCDRLGMLVFQDFVNGGAPYSKFLIAAAPFLHLPINDHSPRKMKRLGRGDYDSRRQFLNDLSGTAEHLYNSPSIVGWTIFNEGWGQFETFKSFAILKTIDGSRVVDADSGWYDQGIGDFDSHHVYFRKVRLKNKGGRILSLSEFGGYSLKVPEHFDDKKAFGYKFFQDQAGLEKGVASLYEKQILPLIEKEGLSVLVYTQLSDVEGEVNGLLTYDRKVIKVSPERMKKINASLREAWERFLS